LLAGCKESRGQSQCFRRANPGVHRWARHVGIADAYHNFKKMSEPQQHTPKSLSPAQARALKQKLRSLRWQPEAVMREITLIRKLRSIVSGE
jgi:hypothetical protein